MSRRVTNAGGASERDAIYVDDLDPALLGLGRDGRVTINLEALRRALGLDQIAADAAAAAADSGATAEVDVFAGAGTTGLVPDPTTETGKVLQDDGTWVAAGGGGGAPTTATYVVISLDATLTAERSLAVGAGLSLVDGGANAAVTLDRAALTGDVTASAGSNATTIANDAVSNAKLRNSVGLSVIGRSVNSTGDPADISALSGSESVLIESGFGTVGFGQVNTAGLKDDSVATAKIINKNVTNAKLADMSDQTIKGRTGGTNGSPLDLTAAQAKAILGISGTNTGDQTITLTGDVTGTGTGSFAATIANDAVTNAKAANMATGTIKGRNTAGTGDPEDLTVLPTAVFPALTGDVTTVAGALATTIAANAVTNAKLAQMVQKTFKGRKAAAGTGDPQDMTRDESRTALDATATPTADSVVMSESAGGGGSGKVLISWLKANSGVSALMHVTIGDVVEWKEPANDCTVPLWKSTTTNIAIVRFGGTTAFPATPCDGQWVYHDTFRSGFKRDDAATRWLSDAIYGVPFGIDADIAATNYLKTGELNTHATFSSTIGWPFHGKMRVVGLSLNMAASGTATIQVFASGSAVTNATLALSAVQSKADETLMSDDLAADSIVAVKVTSGTVEGPARGMIWLRRVETS